MRVICLSLALMIASPSMATLYFTDEFSGKPLPRRSEHLTPKTNYARSLHQCVKNVCDETPPKRTFKDINNAITKRSQESLFYETQILPIFKSTMAYDKKLHQEALTYFSFVQNLPANTRLSSQQIKIGNFQNMSSDRGRLANLPYRKTYIRYGPLNIPEDNSNFLSTHINEQEFIRSKKLGKHPGVSLPFAKAIAQENNLSDFYPLLGNGNGSLFALEENQGQASKRYLVDLYSNTLNEMNNWKNEYPAGLIDTVFKRGWAYHKFIGDNYDEIKGFSTLYNWDLDFTDLIGTIKSQNLIHKALVLTGKDQEQEIPRTTSSKAISDYLKEFKVVLDRDGSLFTKNSYLDRLSQNCKSKLNYIYEGLPSPEEKKYAKQVVAQARVSYLNWVIKNFSMETSTSVTKFLKAWRFYYPPTQDEFKGFLIDYIKLIRKPRQYAYPELIAAPYVLTTRFDHRDWSYQSTNVSFRELNAVCRGLNMEAITDRAFSGSGQIFFGWMSLKDQLLLKTVAWHELAHITSSILRGTAGDNLGQSQINQTFTLNVSKDSFLKFNKTRQCLAEMQHQLPTASIFDEPYKSWFLNGDLPEFKTYPGLKPTQVNSNTVLRFHYSQKWAAENYGRFGVLPDETSMYISKGEKSFFIVNAEGKTTEEDWADFVAAEISSRDSSSNPFCFFLKDRDQLLWNPRLPKPAQPSFFKNKHSSMIFRLLHNEISRESSLPLSCQSFVKSHPEIKHIKNCSPYFQ